MHHNAHVFWLEIEALPTMAKLCKGRIGGGDGVITTCKICISFGECLEHTPVKCMLPTHDKRAQLTNNQYVS